MPCSDGGWGEEEERRERSKVQKKLDNVTRMLCALCEAIERHYPNSNIQQSAGSIEGLRVWWEEHKRKDARRREAERRAEEKRQLQQSGLSKLTHEERKALGLL